MAFLRKLFGPNKEEVWRKLSSEVGGHHVEGGFAKSDKVQVAHGEWTLTLDTFVVLAGKVPVIFTRLRAPYVNPDGFRFTIYRKGVFSEIAKFFGMQDVTVGYEPFDRDFIIKGTDETKLRLLLENPRIRELLEAQPDIHFTVKDDEGWFGPSFPEGVDELYFAITGVIKDIERLKLLYELFGETLEQLCRIGSAYEKAADVAL